MVPRTDWICRKCLRAFTSFGELIHQTTYCYGCTQELLPEALAALEGVVTLAKDCHEHWDKDRDSKVGKILSALAGYLKGYRPDATAVHDVLAKAKPPAEHAHSAGAQSFLRRTQ